MTRRLGGLAVVVAGALALAACGSGFSDDGGSTTTAGETTTADGGGGGGGAGLDILIGSSGDAETDAVKTAVAAWSQESGTAATVRVASNLVQEISQGLASGEPPDLFYVSGDQFEPLAADGSLFAYGDQLGAVSDFYPALVDLFTYDGQFYCAPKDFSTLALIVNTDDWTAAGLTDADIPTTWDQLATVAQKLTTDGRVGLGFSGEYARIASFFVQAGGTMVSADGKTATVDSAENVQALTFVKDQINAGDFAFAAAIGTGWGGEAFGTNKAAMTIEGNWISGALTNDYPDVKYRVEPLPAGPGGQGTLQFSTCWGIPTDSDQHDAAIDLVEYLTSTNQQLEFTKAFGPMPSVQSAAAGFKDEFPQFAAFVDSAGFAQNVVTAQGSSAVITDLNAQLESLASGDPQAILSSVQTNLQAVLDQNNS